MNPYEDAARIKKAHALADTVQAAGGTAQAAADLPHEDRLTAAAVAGVNPPSDATWELVVDLLRKREQAAERLADLGDEFEGLPS